MAIRKKSETSGMLADIIVKGMQEKKGIEIVKLNLSGIPNSITDYFVICHGSSRSQVDAIADSVQFEVKKAIGALPVHREGFENCEWVLLDYFDVVVHVFQTETRSFYQLEKLWADAPREEIKELKQEIKNAVETTSKPVAKKVVKKVENKVVKTVVKTKKN
jgi:ribosome-associated protein